jgi:hypothetical protein
MSRTLVSRRSAGGHLRALKRPRGRRLLLWGSRIRSRWSTCILTWVSYSRHTTRHFINPLHFHSQFVARLDQINLARRLLDMTRAVHSCVRSCADDCKDAAQMFLPPFDVPCHTSRCKLGRFTESDAVPRASKFTASPKAGRARSEDAISELWYSPSDLARQTKEQPALWSPVHQTRYTTCFAGRHILDLYNGKGKHHHAYACTRPEYTDSSHLPDAISDRPRRLDAHSDSAKNMVARTWPLKRIESGAKQVHRAEMYR